MTLARFITILLSVAAAFCCGWLVKSNTPGSLTTEQTKTEAPFVEPVARVVAQGRIVPASGIHNVITTPGQRIESVLVKENDLVKANQTKLATLEGERALDLQTDLVDARADEAATELEQKILSGEANLTATASAVESANLQLAEATKPIDLSVAEQRIQTATEKISRLLLLKSDPNAGVYISQGEISSQQLNVKEAQSKIEDAKRQQNSAIKAAELAVTVAIKSKDSAQRALASLQKLRGEEKSSKLSKQIAIDRRDAARIIAQTDGTVLKLFAKQGDVVGNTPLMQIGDLTDMECIAEVVDRLVGEVKIGQSVTITSPALTKPITGKVSSIGRFVGRSTLANPSPLALVDRKTVDVRIKIDEADIEVASRLVNLQVTVEVATK